MSCQRRKRSLKANDRLKHCLWAVLHEFARPLCRQGHVVPGSWWWMVGTVPIFRKANYEGSTSRTLKHGYSMATNLLVSTVTIALGTLVAASPHRAARIWGSQRLANLAPERRASFVRWYRAFGILLCLAGMLLAADSILLEFAGK
jgi:hypothetical protein